MSFWDRFPQATCIENNCGCSYIYDSLIRQPPNFWSSLFYIFLGLWLYREVKEKSFELKAWVILTIVLGLSSMFAHASFIKIAMAMDFGGIILVLSFFALLNLLELLKVSKGHMLLYFTLYYLSIILIMYSMNKWVKVGICLMIFAFSLGDLIRSIGWSFLRARLLQFSILVLMVSFTLFILDELRIGCDPHSHFPLHSFWHLGTAFSIYLYGKWRFLRQEELPNAG
jgi:hypothetical protein